MPARMPQDNPDNMTIRPGIAAVERLGAAVKRANYAFPHQYAKECMNAGATLRTPGGTPLRSEAAVFEAILLGKKAGGRQLAKPVNFGFPGGMGPERPAS